MGCASSSGKPTTRHIDVMLKVVSAKSVSTLLTDIDRAVQADDTSVTSIRNVYDIRLDSVMTHGVTNKVTRIFVRTVDSEAYALVGWVLAAEVHMCLLCGWKLQNVAEKCHCRACGSVMCASCTVKDVVVSEVHRIGPTVVCRNCFNRDVCLIWSSLCRSLQLNNV